MKPAFEKIRQLAKPFLETRHNDVHTAISTRLAFELLKREGGDEDIVIPAILLHDTGWKQVPEEMHLRAFGPNKTEPQLNRLHEIEGVKIAEEILHKVHYDTFKIKKILEIIDGHDSRQEPVSRNDKIVKDADKLWRYSRAGFYIDIERFGESHAEGLERLRTRIFDKLFTATARAIATEKLTRREKDKMVEPGTAR
jgi:HD superfamily phosphodiesterase